MRTAYLVHGFNVRDDGAGSVDHLISALTARSFRVREADYRRSLFLRVHLCHLGFSRLLASLAEPNSIGIGHSNGCAILHHATRYGAPFTHLVYLNPALDVDASPGHQVKRVDVWHTRHDPRPTLARWIPFTPWDSMGAFGYQGEDSRFYNHLHEYGHSNMFANDGFAEKIGSVLEW